MPNGTNDVTNISEQTPENLSSSGSKNEDQEQTTTASTPTNNGGTTLSGQYPMMHPAFQQQQQLSVQETLNRNSTVIQEQQLVSNGCEKTYTELKLYKQQNGVNTEASLRNHHLEINGVTDPRLMAAALENNSEDGSDGSDSEEIDLTSGSCIDFSSSNKQQQHLSQPLPNIATTNGIH